MLACFLKDTTCRREITRVYSSLDYGEISLLKSTHCCTLKPSRFLCTIHRTGLMTASSCRKSVFSVLFKGPLVCYPHRSANPSVDDQFSALTDRLNISFIRQSVLSMYGSRLLRDSCSGTCSELTTREGVIIRFLSEYKLDVPSRTTHN